MEGTHNKYLRRHGYKYIHVTVGAVITSGHRSEEIHFSNSIFVAEMVYIVAKLADTVL